jgi:uncharacterized protein (UPF0261 family)
LGQPLQKDTDLTRSGVLSPAERATVVLFGALDTKGPEYVYVRDLLQKAGCRVTMVDTGVLGRPDLPGDITRDEVAAAGGTSIPALQSAGDRSVAMTAMSAGAARTARKLRDEGSLDAVMSLGGSNAAYVMSVVAAVLPTGVPKVLVSTIAAGDTRSYVGTADLTLVYPVVDISGLNRISRRILANAAAACAGMALAPPMETGDDRPLAALTMFGVTTACCSAIRDRLAARRIEALTFHATGVGGRSMESLIRSGMIQAVADITTTELADDLVGGVCSAGPERLTAAAEAGVPQVVSLGALDMVNFGPPETVPARFAGRLFHAHNPNVTLMRTSTGECTELGRRIAAKLNAARAPVVLLVPLRGLSQISTTGQPFHDPQADAALFDSLRECLGSNVEVREFDADINDPQLSTVAADLVAGWVRTEGG